MSDGENPKDNRLLAALADADWRRWEPQLEAVDLKSGQVLYEPGRPQRYAYFPTSAIVSLVCLLSNGASTGIAIVGNEGLVGTSLLLGSALTNGHGTVLVAGKALRIAGQTIRDEFDQSDSVMHLLLRYTQTLFTQITQTAVCNRHHSIDQQVCGWLLHSLDRLRGSEVVITQEVLANLLGVRRESVTEAAGQLQAAGLIRYWRGHISVLDREGLERRSCECHAIVKNAYDGLFRKQVAAGPIQPRSPVAFSAADRRQVQAA